MWRWFLQTARTLCCDLSRGSFSQDLPSYLKAILKNENVNIHWRKVAHIWRQPFSNICQIQRFGMPPTSYKILYHWSLLTASLSTSVDQWNERLMCMYMLLVIGFSVVIYKGVYMSKVSWYESSKKQSFESHKFNLVMNWVLQGYLIEKHIKKLQDKWSIHDQDKCFSYAVLY